MIFNIQKCSIHDGDGLRTLVFFKGCPLQCLWCSNPESQSYEKEIVEIPRKCIKCGACHRVCPESAISLENGEFKIGRSFCKKCFKCVDVCYSESKKHVGDEVDIKALFKEINKDRLFYQMYGGGVTFSGGEPLTHPEILTAIAEMCKKNGINTSLETCGYGNYEKFKRALQFIDSMFIDVKHMDTRVHKKLTGVGNEMILSNIKAISGHDIPITIRTPIVPGYNDSTENIMAIASFIKNLPNIREYELLAYHNFGNSKYASLGIRYPLEGVIPPSDEQMMALVRVSNQVLKPFGKQSFYTKDNKREMST